jgi:signal transduction histidine kinase
MKHRENDEGSGESSPLPVSIGSEAGAAESPQLKAVSRVSAALCGLSDLQAILRVGLDTVIDLLGGTAGGIYLLDEEVSALRCRLARGLVAEPGDEVTILLGQGVAGRVVDTGRAVLLGDISRDPESVKEGLETAEIPSLEMGAFASIPLRSRHRVLGALNVVSEIPRRFASDDRYALHSIGEQLGVAIDRAEVLEQLSRGRETYQRLARYCLVAQDEERRRIARELHDETSQSISALALNLRALVEMAEMSGQSQESVERIRRVESLAQETAYELTRIINDLRPGLLDSAGLVPAIRRFAQEHLEVQDVDVRVDVTGTFPRLAPEVEANLFRFAQGAITNIARHAEAHAVFISLDCTGDKLTLRIRDDGRGFDISQITGIDEKTGRGRGLFAMKERIRLLGGSCAVGSAQGEGTTVMAEIPLKEVRDVQDPSLGSR